MTILPRLCRFYRNYNNLKHKQSLIPIVRPNQTLFLRKFFIHLHTQELVEARLWLVKLTFAPSTNVHGKFCENAIFIPKNVLYIQIFLNSYRVAPSMSLHEFIALKFHSKAKKFPMEMCPLKFRGNMP